MTIALAIKFTTELRDRKREIESKLRAFYSLSNHVKAGESYHLVELLAKWKQLQLSEVCLNAIKQ